MCLRPYLTNQVLVRCKEIDRRRYVTYTLSIVWELLGLSLESYATWSMRRKTGRGMNEERRDSSIMGWARKAIGQHLNRQTFSKALFEIVFCERIYAMFPRYLAILSSDRSSRCEKCSKGIKTQKEMAFGTK